MKRRKRLLCRTDGLCGESGGIVLEAALLLPLFLFVLLFLIIMVRVSIIQMALQDASAQAVRQTAAHVYPAWLAAGAREAGGGTNSSTETDGSRDKGQTAALLASLAERLPAPAGPIAAGVINGDWKPAVDMAASKLGGAVVEPLVREMAEPSVLEPDRIRLAELILPDLKGRAGDRLGLVLEYDMPLGLPFTKEKLTIRAAAEERVWIPDSAPAAQREDGGGSGKRQLIRIVGLQPVPVRPGRKARLIVQTDPGGSVSLSVEYKSGTSKARHLGEAKAGQDGIVVWEWLVSGNTTPGTWELIVTAADGGKEGLHFDVEKKTR